MLENILKLHYKRFFLDKIAHYLAKYMTPNKITLCALIVGMCVLPALLFHQNWLAIFFLVLSGYLDSVDGEVARLQSRSSDIGSMLDIISDRIVEASVIIGLFLVNPLDRALLSLCMLASILICITSFLVVGIFTQNNSYKSFHYSPGLMERAEAFLFFIVMILFPRFFSEISTLFCIIVLLTADIRIYQFIKKCGERKML